MARKKAEKAADKALEKAKDAVAEAKRRAKKVDAKARRRAKKVESDLNALASSMKQARVRRRKLESAKVPEASTPPKSAATATNVASGKKASTAKQSKRNVIVSVPVDVPVRAKKAPPSAKAPVPAPTEDLADLTVVQLRARAKEKGVTGYGKFSKAQLVASLSD